MTTNLVYRTIDDQQTSSHWRYNEDISILYGNNTAIVFERIRYWTERSKHYYDDKKWMHKSAKEFAKELPQMSVRTVQNCIKRLVDAGYITIGHYHQDPLYTSNWYTILKEPVSTAPDRKNHRES